MLHQTEDRMVFVKERRDVIHRLLKGWAILLFTSFWPLQKVNSSQNSDKKGAVMKLPNPKTEGTVSVEQAISQRRTVRSFSSDPLDVNQISQLLWSLQGITAKGGFKRAAPSAGALYPMDGYVVVGRDSVKQLDAGVYHYGPQGHLLSLLTGEDLRVALARASLSQIWMARAPINVVITAEYQRATVKYRKRGVRYAMIEAGHIGQNLFLQAEALGLKAGIVGAFRDNEIVRLLKLPTSHEPLLIMPVGYGA